MLAGVKSTFKGQVVGEEYTVWPSQLDFSAELTKAKNSGAQSIFVFYPGAAGVQFLNQYAQAGLKGQMPLYTAFTIDELSLPLQKENALGVPGAQQWVNDLPNAENKKFVEDYRKKYPGLRPTFYGAQSYDAAQLINSAVVAVKGDTAKRLVRTSPYEFFKRIIAGSHLFQGITDATSALPRRRAMVCALA